jgi:hypothetical protein
MSQFRVRESELNKVDLTNLGASLYTNIVPPGCPLVTKGTLTPAQIQNMYSGPIEILPTPQTGFNDIIRIVYQLNFNTTLYQNGGPTIVYYGNPNNSIPASSSLQSSFLISATGSQFQNVNVATFNFQSGGVYLSNVQQPLYITNTTSPFTNGDSTLSYSIYYNNVILP